MIQDYCKEERKEKKMKKIKILTITLVISVITMIAFWGVNTQVQNRMENQVKGYEYAMDLKGSRNIRLKVNTGTKTTIKDAEGKEVEESDTLTDEQIAEKGYKKEETPNNKDEVKTSENYNISKKVIQKRLEKLGVTNYIIKLDEATGDIVIELTENDNTDSVISNLTNTGKFEIVDSETKEVLMDNSDIKQARVMYGSGNNQTTTNSGTTIYLDIEFNKEGAKKLEEISNQYVKIESTEETTEGTEEAAEQTTAEKKITMQIDEEEIMSTSFEEPVRTGKLQLSIGSASTDQKTLQGYVTQASSMATILDTQNMPVKYDLAENQYILTDITESQVEIAIYIILAIIVIAAIVLIVKFKVLGALGVISYIGFISLFMLVVRYANVVLSIEGLFGMMIAAILNYIFLYQFIKKVGEIKNVYKSFWTQMIPIIIMVIAFCFSSWTSISSFGMVMFWGIVLIAIYNSIVTNSLLKIETRKEK